MSSSFAETLLSFKVLDNDCPLARKGARAPWATTPLLREVLEELLERAVRRQVGHRELRP